MGFKKSNYSFRGHNQIVLDDDLENEIKKRFDDDRENRFQLFLLSSSIRRKYLDKKTKKYTKEFESWYKSKGLEEYYGLIEFHQILWVWGCGELHRNKDIRPTKILKTITVIGWFPLRTINDFSFL